MRSLLILVLAVVLQVNTLNAQVFYDDFSDNRNSWRTFHKSNAQVDMNNGLNIYQKSSKVNAYVTKNSGDTFNEISEIECSLKKFSGATGIGIVWNFKDIETHNRFIITTRDQQFFIQYRVNGVREKIKAWTSNTAISKGDGTNIFKLKQIGKSVQFYVNGTLVHTQRNSKLSGNGMGVLLGSTLSSKCKVNYFKVTGKSSQEANVPPEIVITEPNVSRGFKVVQQETVKVSGRAIDRDGIYQVKVNGYDATLQSGGYFTVYIPLSVGSNSIIVKATDTKMKSSTHSFEISRQTNNQVVESPKVNQKRIALIIGNANYIHGGKLLNPTNDARAMKTALQNLGFTVIKYENCSQSTMKRAIDEFGTKLKNYDVGLFFYAGHGVQFDGRNYLIPVNAKLENKNDVDYDCVRTGRILAKMESAGTQTNIIILDACRNNPFERSWNRGGKGNGLAFMNAPSGSLVAYATSPGNTASDGSGYNGLYTSALLKHLKTPDITIEEVFKEVRKTVMKKSGGKQIPWESTSLMGDFYFK